MFKTPTQIANRRRLIVFSATFLLLAAAGLLWCFSRPPTYLAQARVQINPGQVQVEAVVASGATVGTNTSRTLLTELQVLTSRPLVEQAVAGLRGAGEKLAMPLAKPPAAQDALTALGVDPVTLLQTGLEAKLATGTDIVEISSRGPDADLAAALVNEIIKTYAAQLDKSYQSTAGSSLAQISDEVSQLTAKVQAKNQQIEEFRVRNNIISLERDENATLGQVKGQTEALNKAHERQAIADGKLRAMSEAVASGKPAALPARQSATLDNLEQRAVAIREEMNELNRLYTPDYLAMDPKFRALRGRLAEVERQTAEQRQTTTQAAQTGQSTALAEAREEAAAAREAVSRIQQQIGSARGNLNQFSAKFSQYVALTKEVAPMENLLRDATQRKASLEAGELARRPSVQVVEPAVVPKEAWQPQYQRDAAIVLGVALALALLAMWVVELFNREEVQPTMLVAQAFGYGAPAYGIGSNGGSGSMGLGHTPNGAPRLAAASARDPQNGEVAMLSAPVPAPRELIDEELQAILHNATPQVRRFVHLLLRGVTAEEALALKTGDVDTACRVVHVAGARPRDVALDSALDAALQAQSVRSASVQATSDPVTAPAIDGRLLATNDLEKPSLADLTTGLLYAAHDAGVEAPVEVTPEAIWHTGAAHLARQGIRMADLARALGPLTPQQAALYSSLAPTGKRLAWDEVAHLVPAATV